MELAFALDLSELGVDERDRTVGREGIDVGESVGLFRDLPARRAVGRGVGGGLGVDTGGLEGLRTKKSRAADQSAPWISLSS